MKKTRLPLWRRMPTLWINEGELKKLSWVRHGADATVALMVIIVLAHRRQIEEDGTMFETVMATYADLCRTLNVSRTKISGGLKLLEEMGWIKRHPERSTFSFTSPDVPWGKIPVRTLYDAHGAIPAFDSWKLRSPLELDALKVYLVLCAFRDVRRNDTRISYTKIQDYTGIQPGKIKGATNLLVISNMIYVELEEPTWDNKFQRINEYRIRGTDAYRHKGTQSVDDYRTDPDFTF